MAILRGNPYPDLMSRPQSFSNDSFTVMSAGRLLPSSVLIRPSVQLKRLPLHHSNIDFPTARYVSSSSKTAGPGPSRLPRQQSSPLQQLNTLRKLYENVAAEPRKSQKAHIIAQYTDLRDLLEQ